jgi:hypothetical protein
MIQQLSVENSSRDALFITLASAIGVALDMGGGVDTVGEAINTRLADKPGMSATVLIESVDSGSRRRTEIRKRMNDSPVAHSIVCDWLQAFRFNVVVGGRTRLRGSQI